MHLPGGDRLAAEVEVAGRAGVVRDRRLEAQVDRRADGRVDAHARHHPADDHVLDPAGAKLVLERRVEEAVRARLLDDRLAGGGRDAVVDLDTVRAGPHERRVGRVPDVLDVKQRLAARPERLEQPLRVRGRRLRADERVRPAREVVVLDVDDDEGARHQKRAVAPSQRSCAPVSRISPIVAITRSSSSFVL